MKLFTKDRFSDSTIRLREIKDEGETVILVNILKQFQISLQGLDAISLYSFGDLGINSSNYLVSVGSKKYVIKKLNDRSEVELDFYCNLSNELRRELEVFPFFRKCHSNKLYHDDKSSLYCLLDYIEGEFFKGTKAQLEEVATAINRLHSYCASKSRLGFLPSREFDLIRINKVLQNFLESNSKRRFLNRTQESMVSNNITSFYRALDYLSNTNRSHLGKEELVHIDLHPHNILYKNDTLMSILDINSFKLGQPCIAYGFAAYKLYRQSIAYDHTIARNFSIFKFIEHMKINYDARLLLKGALIEVLTRATIILEPILEGEKSPWISVLDIQLLGILEVLHFLDIAHE
ncbi:phosphotransferase [Synechococcus sp. MU1611]|uniref:phosphotransferase n=1 Tax=Synechococcus sp. MU1611 TaxID=2508345 RepID=UPI001CF86DEE|nr:phosphotransferase [Synechococcus sp. MU1611]MCB4412613.1 phosphotransferase [Synechococcus sp. MU1611]